MHKIIVLSDGATWETFDPQRVAILEITDEAMKKLCDGDEPHNLNADDDVQSDQTLADLLNAKVAKDNA